MISAAYLLEFAVHVLGTLSQQHSRSHEAAGLLHGTSGATKRIVFE